MNTPRSGRSKESKARKQLTSEEFFFYQNAGYSYIPDKETAEQGRIRCAKQLAKAEHEASTRDWEFLWADDWSIGSHRKEFDTYEHESDTCECCAIRNSSGEVLASLGCIDDADNSYRRVIEAELASEALAVELADQEREADLQQFINTAYAL